MVFDFLESHMHAWFRALMLHLKMFLDLYTELFDIVWYTVAGAESRVTK